MDYARFLIFSTGFCEVGYCFFLFLGYNKKINMTIKSQKPLRGLLLLVVLLNSQSGKVFGFETLKK
jgi:hypothetical protein